MTSSIALPSADYVDATLTHVRAFIEHEGEFIEITAPPFCGSTLCDLRLTRWYFETFEGMQREWSTYLFFPEAWPPGLILDYLRSHTWQAGIPGLE